MSAARYVCNITLEVKNGKIISVLSSQQTNKHSRHMPIITKIHRSLQSSLICMQHDVKIEIRNQLIRNKDHKKQVDSP